MADLAIIGGSGFTRFPGLIELETRLPETTWGRPSGHLVLGELEGRRLWFLPRHGQGHSLAPHRVNSRANIQALADMGITRIIALSAVGGIAPDCSPLRLCLPDQIIDYTYGRPNSFFDGEVDFDPESHHIDFSYPFDAGLRQQLLAAAESLSLDVRAHAVVGVTQGPRLETAAEIARMARDGCDLVNMTSMPEAALARERGIAYATLAFVVNRAAGCAEGEVSMQEVAVNLVQCTDIVQRLLRQLLLSDAQCNGC